VTRSRLPELLSTRFRGIYNLLLNKFYVDEIYDATVVTPISKGSEKLLWRVIDVGVIDWTVNALGRFVAFLSTSSRVVQTGAAQSYVFVFLVGVIAIVGWLVMK
jgi:NADH-quinone oxidoreductase subunit L